MLPEEQPMAAPTGEGSPAPVETPTADHSATVPVTTGDTPAAVDPQLEPTAPPVDPESQSKPEEPTPDSSTDEDDDDAEHDDAPLPATKEEAITELLRLRKLYRAMMLRNRKWREQKNAAGRDVARLTEETGKAQTKLEKISSELNAAATRADAAEVERDAIKAERDLYRQELLTKFSDGAHRELASSLPLDKLPALYEQLNGKPMFAAKEAPPSTGRHPVTRESPPKPKAKSFGEYFDRK